MHESSGLLEHYSKLLAKENKKEEMQKRKKREQAVSS